MNVQGQFEEWKRALTQNVDPKQSFFLLTGDSELSPSDVIGFAMLHARVLLATKVLLLHVM